jgi:serine/threonine-protein kinase
MEFLEGNDLNQILRHHGPQLPAIVVDLMLQACEGIAEAHALGIVHRDIKPSNFFITRRPDGSMLLKILDFGISKTPVGFDELTATQTVLGTPSYMAPEQMKSGRSADPRSDIWSLGVVIYQLLTGRTPFSGESYAELVLKVGLEPPAPILVPLPPGLGDVILHCLEKDPAARFQNVGDLARMLAPYATDPIAAAQAANRAIRILQQRGLHAAMQTSPLTAGGGLPTPIPISPAQLTPRSWPPSSQSTSLSHGAGQVTLRARGNRSLLIAGIASLCVLAGVGGYAISQLSRSGSPAIESHAQPAASPSTVEHAEAPTSAQPPGTNGAQPGATARSADGKPAQGAQPSGSAQAPAPGDQSPQRTVGAQSPTPTGAQSPPPGGAVPAPNAQSPPSNAGAQSLPPKAPAQSALPKLDAQGTEPKLGAQDPKHTAQSPEPKPSTHASDPKSTQTTDSKSTHATDPKSSTHTTDSTSTHATDSKSTHATDSKSSSKPKSSKPKSSGDLFDSRH